MQTVGAITGQTPHFSLLRRRFERLAGERGVHVWLMDEANRRGYLGAFNSDRPQVPLTHEISDEQLVVGLLMPQAEADARTWKLVVRMLQSEKLRLSELAFLARMERAEVLLYWLLLQVPPEEATAPILQLRSELKQPRGFSGVRYRYEPSRLIRRPAAKGDLWRPKPS